MPVPHMKSISGLLLLAALGAPAAAHDDDPKLLDRVPPHPGRGVRTGLPAPGGSGAQAASIEFPRSGVTLLAWLTLGEFGNHDSGNDCWGYTSPSGREYALIGLSDGTGFVEITQPNDPQIVAVHSGPGSLWRDVKVFQHYAYAVSEGGSGIQVFDMAQIDAGAVTFLGTVTTGGDTATHNVAIDTDSGYLYRTGGGNNGLRIYDLNANPTSPTFVGSWSSKYVHDVQVKTYTSGPAAGKQIAFACSGFNGGFSQTGLSVLDVTNKASPVVLKEVFWPNPGYSHQAWLSEDLQHLYLNDELDENGVFPTTTYVVHVGDPANAAYVGSFTNGNTAVGHNLYTRGDLIYEANYRSGLRVFDASASATQPTEAYWFDVWPSDDGDEFNGLWSVYPYFQSGVVIGSDMEKGLFVWWVGPPLVSLDVPQGAPALLQPGGDSLLAQITELNPGALVPGSARLHYDAGAGYQAQPLVDLGGGSYRADFPALPCGSNVTWFLAAESTNGIVWSWPEGGTSNPLTTLVAFGQTIAVDLDMETNPGWTVGMPGDDATTGIWTRVDPVGTAAQPEDDHTPAPGILCWVTGQGLVGGGIGDNDVDGGVTTLVTGNLALSALSDPRIGYWRWYSNDQGGAPNADVFEVQISNGGAWIPVETVGPAGPETSGGWFHHDFRVADFVAPNDSVRVRFRASDYGAGSIVEAAVDDFRVIDVDCSQQPSIYCTAKLNSQACLPAIGFAGSPSASSPAAFDITCDQVVPAQIGLLFFGYAASASPFQGGTLCVQPPTVRTGVQGSGGAGICSGAYALDFNPLIQGGTQPGLTAGATVHAQYWYRDPQDPAGFGTGLSDAIQFTIQP